VKTSAPISMTTNAPACASRNGSLAKFQDAFARALLAPTDTPSREIAALAGQPSFAVYRNTVMKGCIDALQANYPAVARLVGAEWFRAASAIYVRSVPPTVPMLSQYGESFAEFLARFEPAAELPYLAGVARLDRMWTEAHIARDELLLDAAAFARIEPLMLAHVVLHPHGASRWSWFADEPIFTIWSRNRVGDPTGVELEWQGEGALLTRPHGAVEWTALDAAGCAFLDACAAGCTLDAAALAARAVKGDTDLARLMKILVAAGAFGRMNINGRNSVGKAIP